MKVRAELELIKEGMTSKELTDCLNTNFIEINEASESRDLAIHEKLNTIDGRLNNIESDIRIIKSDINVLKSDVGGLKSDMKLVLDHLSGIKKLLTEE